MACLLRDFEVETKVTEIHYFDEYETRHQAMRLLSDAWWETDDQRIKSIIKRATDHVREAALELIPYSSTTPNKDSYGRRYGRQV